MRLYIILIIIVETRVDEIEKKLKDYNGGA